MRGTRTLVKIDKYFIHDVATEPIKVQTLRGLMRFAETFGTTLVAAGIEAEDELRVVRDPGIELGQGSTWSQRHSRRIVRSALLHWSMTASQWDR